MISHDGKTTKARRLRAAISAGQDDPPSRPPPPTDIEVIDLKGVLGKALPSVEKAKLSRSESCI